MKVVFWLGIIGLLAFELLNVYFIMPMPGSQEMNSIDAAYFLYQWRWIFRAVFIFMILVGLIKARVKRRWLLFIPVLLVGAISYVTNFVMAADHMFYQPKQLLLLPASSSKVDTGRLVLGIQHNGVSKAYPIQYLGYHHQVMDTIGGKPVIVTYCTVCRTGRVYEPMVDGKPEKFRLVGMDHFNAMLEDETTGSWWRQVNGEAITGKAKGKRLKEFFSTQTTLAKWLALNPASLIMQADPAFLTSYDSTFKYEYGLSRNSLTGTDSLSWKDKSWVIGIKVGDSQKAYDWNRLLKEQVIHDTINKTPVLVLLANDHKSFFAFERPSDTSYFQLQGDTLINQNNRFHINGKSIGAATDLRPLPAYQEFWHSWRTFNPGSTKY